MNSVVVKENKPQNTNPKIGDLWISSNGNVVILIPVETIADNFSSLYYGAVNLSTGEVHFLAEGFQSLPDLVSYLVEEAFSPLTSEIVITPG